MFCGYDYKANDSNCKRIRYVLNNILGKWLKKAAPMFVRLSSVNVQDSLEPDSCLNIKDVFFILITAHLHHVGFCKWLMSAGNLKCIIATDKRNSKMEGSVNGSAAIFLIWKVKGPSPSQQDHSSLLETSTCNFRMPVTLTTFSHL